MDAPAHGSALGFELGTGGRQVCIVAAALQYLSKHPHGSWLTGLWGGAVVGLARHGLWTLSFTHAPLVGHLYSR